MKIRRLKLSGFKSFVEPADLRIEPGLTGIVGPNGCGKSNLLEAIRWAMGESSPKSLRGGGMDDVIFAGTATRAHSPALVSQGKIGAVISAKPVERRLLLEEAAGISGLHARRKDAEQKLRATEANLARLAEILGDQEQRAAQLRRQARAAERYRKITEQIRGVEARLLHARWTEAEQAA